MSVSLSVFHGKTEQRIVMIFEVEIVEGVDSDKEFLSFSKESEGHYLKVGIVKVCMHMHNI